TGSRSGESLARAVAAFHRMMLSGDPQLDVLEELATEALEQLDSGRDHAELVHLWSVLGFGVANFRGRFEDVARADEEALRHARLAGYRQWRPFGLEFALRVGPRPADEALRTLDALVPEDPNPGTQLTRAVLIAMLGRVEEGRRMGVEACRRLSELAGENPGY